MKLERHPDLDEHFAYRGLRKSVSFTPEGFRDVIWCPYLNEPAILEYDTLKEGSPPKCPNCENYEPCSHQFICHIRKPRW